MAVKLSWANRIGQVLGSSRTLNLLLILGFLLLTLSSIRGFYAHDFFSLWGLHAKWVWTTGDFWLAGADLPTNIFYQSVLGSVVGKSAQVLGYTHMPDAWLGVANFLLVTLLTVLFAWFVPLRYRQHFVLKIFILYFLIKPVFWAVLGFGAYTDLSSSLLLCMAFFALWNWPARRAYLVFALMAFLSLLMRPPTWPYFIIFLLASALSQTLTIMRLGVASVLFFVAKISVELLYSSETSVAATYAATWERYTLSEWLMYPWYWFKTNNLALGLLSLFVFIKFRRFKREAWLVAGGVGFLFLSYLTQFGRTQGELFPALGRYTLPVYLVVGFTVPSLADDWVRRHRAKIVMVLLLLLVVRAGEEIPIYKRDGGWAVRSQACVRFKQACQEGRDMAAKLSSRANECDAFRVQKLVRDFESMQVAYFALPVRLYFRESKVPASLKVCEAGF